MPIESWRIEKNALDNISEVVMDSYEWNAIISTPVRHPEGQKSLLIGEMRESTKYRGHFFTEEVL